jgi:hypothetical protein
MVIKYNHGIEHPKRRGRDGEHIDRDDDRHMIPQKAAPSRGGSFWAPRQIPSNGGLTNLDTELEQVRRGREVRPAERRCAGIWHSLILV